MSLLLATSSGPLTACHQQTGLISMGERLAEVSCAMCNPNPEGPIKLDLERWDRWVQWIEKVRIDLKSALVDRTVFRRFSDIVRDNRAWIAEHYGGRFREFVARAYVAQVAAAVRRHSRSHKDAITLTGILEQ